MPSSPQITKPHFPILDGLRGVAAVLVVIYHLFEACYPVPATHPENHGYLAVDFFFLLSGFVIGYAYDDRWNSMRVADFFKRRLIRLHPLVIAGVLIGALCFWLDPYTDGRHHVSFGFLLLTLVISLTLLPSPDIRGWGETHSLDGPCWSLLQEYIANMLYALFARKLSRAALAAFVLLFAAALTITAIWHGDVATGWGYSSFWIAVVRMLYPFFAGLLLFRTGRFIRLPMPFFCCAGLLVILFFLPRFHYNGLYEAGCIIIGFPLIVAAGAGGTVTGRWLQLCRFSGAISYPIYLLHYPFVYIYTMWIATQKPTPARIVPVALGLFIVFFCLAFAALKLYDLPVRTWLGKKFGVTGKILETRVPERT